MLDESHLELLEDVLKEINFNNKDWPILGRGLGVHVEQQEYSYIENFLILKECLRKWLSSGAARYRSQIRSLPTLDGLADALKSIGYREAGEYIIKTCKLIIMFNDQCMLLVY